MSHHVDLIVLLAAGFGLALIFGYIASRLRLPPLVGYLVAGIIISPNTPGIVADINLANQLAELGVMFLMFGVGMHFSIADLNAVKRIAIPGALVQMAVAICLGMLTTQLWGWSLGSGFVFGLCLSVASTVVLLRALEAKGLLHTINGQIAVGWLLVEDLVMVLALVLLPLTAVFLGGQALGGATPQNMTEIWSTIGITLLKVATFIGLMFVVGKRLIPKAMLMVSKIGSRELFTLTVTAAAVSIAYGAYALFGVSMALGAFIAGMVVKESDFSHRAEEETLALREIFSILFFVSVGMLFNPLILVEEPLKVLAVVAIIVLGKTLAAVALVLFFRYPLNTALTVGAGLAQIGEFSFILATLGVALQLLTIDAQNLILAGALISISLNTALFAMIEPVQRWIRQRSDLARLLERSGDPLAMLPEEVDQQYLTGQVVIVGYGTVGRYLEKALKEQNIRYVIAEQNREIVESLRAKGIPAVSGDASEPAVLIQAHIHKASMLMVTMPDTFDVVKMIETAHLLNPQIESVICSDSIEEAQLLGQLAKTQVYLEKQALADKMAGHVLARLGRQPTGTHRALSH